MSPIIGITKDELNWIDLSAHIGRDIREYTTVTNRLRRIFTWSNEQTKKMCVLIKPDYAFLNFTNYLCGNEYNTVIKQTSNLLIEYNCKLRLLGTGAGLEDMIDLGVN